MPTAWSLPVPVIVLDTNAVLDWLVFRHPACVRWTACFTEGAAVWMATPAMRAELAHVLDRPALAAWHPQMDVVWSAWERLAEIRYAAAQPGAAGRVRCTDPDDQKFIDLALAEGARWLVSRDRAVLKLGRRTRPLGLEVLTPESWAASFPAG